MKLPEKRIRNMFDWHYICEKQRPVFLAIICCFLLAGANVQAGMTQSEIDEITANWNCQWCPYKKEPHKKTDVDVGVGAVSNDSFKHGKYTGLDQQGNYLVGNGNFEYKDEKSNYVDAQVRDIGLDSRQVDIEGGLQGRYDISLQYWALPNLISDTARTPYRGSEDQRLPAGWVDGANTNAMTQLASSLRDVDIYTERKTINVGARFHASPTMSYELNFEQQKKQGNKSTGLTLLTNSVILAVPVDTTTKQGGIKVNYRAHRWQGSLGYRFSFFDNADDHVSWENPYTTPATATEGQAAQEPENEMQQIYLDGNYQISVDTNATLAIALGRMTQNADFLPFTVNGSLTPSPLPRTSLDGEVNTYSTTLKISSRLNDDWNYFVQYRRNEQANKTPREIYNYVFADFVVSSTPRTNFPYSFREEEWSLQGKYQINKQRQIVLDYQREKYDRTYQEVDTTIDNKLSLSYRSNVNDYLQWSLRLNADNRVGDDYTAVSEIDPPENTLLRKYNLADRKRKMVGASLSYSLTEELQLNVFGDYAFDDYLESDVGLQESQQKTVTLEVQYRLNQDLAMNLDYSATDIESNQIGNTWTAENVDSVYVSHISINYKIPKYKLSVGADYTHANVIGDIKVSTGNGFPKLESTRKTLSLFAEYALDERSAIHAIFAYEDYEESDWAIEDVAPNTINSVLTLGEVSPSYDIGVFAISYRTSF